MPRLKAVYENQGDIPEALKEYYSETNGKWFLESIEGLSPSEDVDRVRSALDKEKNDHKETKEKLRKFEGVDPEKVHSDMDELQELRATRDAGKLETPGQDKIDELVEARVRKETAPLERELKQLRTRNEELENDNKSLTTNLNTTQISSEITQAAAAAGIDAKEHPQALRDLIYFAEADFERDENGNLITRDGRENGGDGPPPGLTPSQWIDEYVKAKRPYMWPRSVGGGAGGSGGEGGAGAENPWSSAGWNETKQAQIINEDSAKAERLAQMAGTSLGGPRPQPRPQPAKS